MRLRGILRFLPASLLGLRRLRESFAKLLLSGGDAAQWDDSPGGVRARQF
jgi:hypothetical protein